MFSIRATGGSSWTPCEYPTDELLDFSGLLEKQELPEVPCNLPQWAKSSPPSPKVNQLAVSGYELSSCSWGHLLVESNGWNRIDIQIDDGNDDAFVLSKFRVIRERPVGDSLWLLTVTDDSWYSRQIVHDGIDDTFTNWTTLLDSWTTRLGYTRSVAVPGSLPTGYGLDHWKGVNLKGQSVAAILDYACALLGLRAVLDGSAVTYFAASYAGPDLTDEGEGGSGYVNTVGGNSTKVYWTAGTGGIASISSAGNYRTFWIPDGFSISTTASGAEAWRNQSIFLGGLDGGPSASDPATPYWNYIVYEGLFPRPMARMIAGNAGNSLQPSKPIIATGVSTGVTNENDLSSFIATNVWYPSNASMLFNVPVTGSYVAESVIATVLQFTSTGTSLGSNYCAIQGRFYNTTQGVQVGGSIFMLNRAADDFAAFAGLRRNYASAPMNAQFTAKAGDAIQTQFQLVPGSGYSGIDGRIDGAYSQTIWAPSIG